MAKHSKVSFIALGSNLDNPILQIENAIKIIGKNSSISNVKRAELYKSKPLGPQDQPDFINTVIRVETTFSANELLNFLLDTEIKLGRVRGVHWGPRVIDLDIITYADLEINTEKLTVPHPRAFEREFVIVPIADINTDLVIKGQGKVSDLLLDFQHHKMEKVSLQK